MKNKLLCLLLAVVLLWSACSAQSKTLSPTSAPTNEPTPEPTAPPTPEPTTPPHTFDRYGLVATEEEFVELYEQALSMTLDTGFNLTDVTMECTSKTDEGTIYFVDISDIDFPVSLTIGKHKDYGTDTIWLVYYNTPDDPIPVEFAYFLVALYMTYDPFCSVSEAADKLQDLLGDMQKEVSIIDDGVELKYIPLSGGSYLFSIGVAN